MPENIIHDVIVGEIYLYFQKTFFSCFSDLKLELPNLVLQVLLP